MQIKIKNSTLELVNGDITEMDTDPETASNYHAKQGFISCSGIAISEREVSL